MKKKSERFERLAIFAVAIALMVSFVALTASTADNDRSPLTTSFRSDVSRVSTPAGPRPISQDPVIWDNGGSNAGYYLASSQNDAVYPFVSQTADDFMFTEDMDVTDVHWWGGFWNGPPDEVEPCPFYIYFYADDGTGNAPTGAGMPDPAPTALASYYFPGVSGLPLDPNGYYEYDVDLSPPFSATAGVKYWIAIQADFPYPPQWGWTDTDGIQLHSATQGFPFLGTVFWTDLDPAVDMAYYLTGIPDEQWPNHKMHFPQTPRPGGCDVEFNATRLADDWMCSETGPVTDIHFWISWMQDNVQTINNMRVGIWSNNPVGPDGYSVPDILLWERVFYSGDFGIIECDPDWQSWLCAVPEQQVCWLQDHTLWSQINIENIQDPFIQQENTIYWLEIDFGPLPYIGWKETDQNWNDDPVIWYGAKWEKVIKPAPCDSLIDLAFVITGPDSGDGHKMHFPQTPRPGGCDVEFNATRLADDWMCTETGPVTDIHFWISWMQDNVRTIDDLRVGIWSNNPVGPHGYSVPASLLWERIFYSGDFGITPCAPDSQDWLMAISPYYVENDHTLWSQIRIEDIEDPFIQEEGTIYWLEIDFGPLPYIGWKETDQNWNDAAVIWDYNYWKEVRNPVNDSLIHLAFVIGPEMAICGDVNNDGIVNIGDVVYLIGYLYKGGPPPIPRECVGDVNNDGIVNIGDVVYLIGYLYKGGPPSSCFCCIPPWGK